MLLVAKFLDDLRSVLGGLGRLLMRVTLLGGDPSNRTPS